MTTEAPATKKSPFKAYDVRGKYPSDIDERFAKKFGCALARYLGARKVAVGRDVRISAPQIAKAVCEGITAAGAVAVDIGCITTPMLYFAVASGDLDGGVMVTASHNPPQDIGFKPVREYAQPIGQQTGLKDIEKMMADPPENGSGHVEPRSVVAGYRRHIRSFIAKAPRMRIAVDTANGAVGVHFNAILGDLPGIEWIPLYFEPDGRFPNHECNPLKDENIRDLQAVVRERGADLGVAFDGDGDRVMFVGPDGERVRADLITIVMALTELKKNPGARIIYDIRSSRVVPEEVLKAGGIPIRTRVGHSFIKATMRAQNAAMGGELSGHYYFRDHFGTDSGMVALAKVLDCLGNEGRPIAEVMAPYLRTVISGEINFHVEDKAAALRRLRSTFADGIQDELDGVTIGYPDWWFNVRQSNTEPVLRLNVEANTHRLLDTALERLFRILGKPE